MRNRGSVTIIDTGEIYPDRRALKRIAHHLDPNEPFCMTYGDGVSDINIADLIDFHRRMGVEATVTAVHLPGRFGSLDIGESKVTYFAEKPPGDGGMINGGFFVLNPGVIDRIENDATVWEKSPLEGLARDGQLGAYRHDGFWHAMDTLRDKQLLDRLWSEGKPPWKVWP